MLGFDGGRQHDDATRAARRQHEPSCRRAHARERPKRSFSKRDALVTDTDELCRTMASGV
jgi:hypothetical protein